MTVARPLRLAFLLFAALLFISCSSPTGPDGYNPNKPIDRNNVPKCTGNCALATFTYGVYEGDCVDDASTCTKEIFRTEDSSKWVDGRENTYLVKNYTQRYTIHLWVTHSGVALRRMALGVQAPRNSVFTGTPFNEGDRPSPVHMAASFNMTFNSGGITNTDIGKLTLNEGGWDLALEPRSWETLLGFRVVFGS